MKKTKNHAINLRLFAEVNDVIANHADAFGEDSKSFGENFNGITEKLKGLGYDVIINNREAAEFVPSSRLGEVVGQRDGFKAQAEKLQTELLTLKNNKNVPEEVQTQLQTMMDTNSTLLKELEQSNINFEIVTAAADAINPKDVLAFVNMDKVKLKDGKVQSGLKEELDRLRSEKPYLFNASNSNSSKGGSDTGGNGGSGDQSGISMNSLIRRGASHTI